MGALHVTTVNLYTKRNDKKVLKFWRVVNSLKHEKTVKECSDIQTRGPGHLPGWPNGTSGPAHVSCNLI